MTVESHETAVCNGGVLAAAMSAAVGAFAMGMLVIANEAGIFAAPSIYGPAGGLSGRSTFALAAWLIAWMVLHRRWRSRSLSVRRVATVAFAFLALGLVMTFPPVWSLL